LSPELEQNLVDWILAEDRAGLPPTYARIRSMVTGLQDILGDSTGLGGNWHRRFVKRHKSIKISKQRVIESDRVNYCNSETISEFFDRYEGLISKYHINHENRWNMDESGLQSYEAGNESVVGSSQAQGKRAVSKRPARTCWNTALEAISAAGRKIDPLIIYTGKNVYSIYLPRNFDASKNKDWRLQLLRTVGQVMILESTGSRKCLYPKLSLVIDGPGAYWSSTTTAPTVPTVSYV
jgi:hypothetical protein